MVDSAEQPQGARNPAGLGLGERLRSARKARALSVTQVAEALHLEEPMVLALEEERFAALGAPVFVRGHLRRYAQLVGLAPEAVLEAYRAAVPDSVAPPSLARSRVEPETIRIGGWVFWLIGALVIAGLVFAVGGREERAEPPAATVELPQELAPQPEADATPENAPAPPDPAGADGATGSGGSAGPPAAQAPAATPAGSGE